MRSRHSSGTSLVVLLDVGTWRSSALRERRQPTDPEDTAAVFAAAGWRVVPLRAGELLADVWPYVAHPAATFGDGRR